MNRQGERESSPRVVDHGHVDVWPLEDGQGAVCQAEGAGDHEGGAHVVVDLVHVEVGPLKQLLHDLKVESHQYVNNLFWDLQVTRSDSREN